MNWTGEPIDTLYRLNDPKNALIVKSWASVMVADVPIAEMLIPPELGLIMVELVINDTALPRRIPDVFKLMVPFCAGVVIVSPNETKPAPICVKLDPAPTSPKVMVAPTD